MGPILSVNGGLPPVHVRVVWTHSVMVVLSRVIVEALATGAKEALKSTSATVDARERSLVTSFLGPRATGDCTGWRTSMSLPIDVTECLNNWESVRKSVCFYSSQRSSLSYRCRLPWRRCVKGSLPLFGAEWTVRG